MRLSAADEFFNHQAAFPHMIVASSDPSWRERYWICMQDTRNRDTVVTLGLGKYPNQDVMEGFAAVAHKGRQYNVRLSRALLPSHDSMGVGALKVDVVEPFKRLHLTLGDNPSGLRFDLHWTARFDPLLEDRHFQIHRARVVHELVRYVQFGRVSGTLETPEGQIVLDEEHWWTMRDHSWGTRPLPRAPGEPPATLPWRFLMFCPLQFQDFAIHFYLWEWAPGRPVHLSASLVRRDGEVDDAVVTIDHDLRWQEGAKIPTLSTGEIRIGFASGRDMTIRLKSHPVRAFLKGGGYGMNQGRWQGEDHAEHECWNLESASDEELKSYSYASSDHLVEAECDGQQGYGIVEYIVLKDYGKYEVAQVGL